jgi:hypothetical protein
MRNTSKSSLYKIVRPNAFALAVGDVVERVGAVGPMPLLFAEIAEPFSGSRPADVKPVNFEFFKQREVHPDVARPKRREIDARGLCQRFGWTDAQFERAAALGMPKSIGYRGKWIGLRPRDVKIWDADQVDRWWQELAGFVGSTQIED